jgi:hypothetical protein
VDFPVFRQVKLISVPFPVDLLNDEGTSALLAEFRAVLAGDLVAVVEPQEGPIPRL